MTARNAGGQFLWSRQKRNERADLRAFKARKEEIALDVSRAANGEWLAVRASRGTAYAHPEVTRRARELRCAYAVRSTGEVLSDGELVVLAWIAAADLGLARGCGVVISLDQLADVVGCSPRTAGTRLRRLVALGAVVRTPHYQEQEPPPQAPWRRHLRGPNLYRVGLVAHDIIAGKYCQAGETHTQTLKGSSSACPAAPCAGVQGAAAPRGGTSDLRDAPPDEEAPEGEGRPLAWRRYTARLRRDLARLVEEGRQRDADAAAARQCALAWSRASASSITRETARESEARLDGPIARLVAARLVAEGLATGLHQAAAQWADGLTHRPRCSCAVCMHRRELSRHELSQKEKT